MTPPVVTLWSKVLAGLMGLVFILSAGWAWRQWPAVDRLQRATALIEPAGKLYRPAEFVPPAASALFWPAPPVPASPTDWLFEEFSPPLIFFDRQARTFAVTAPQLTAVNPGPFGLELEEIRLEPYRVQLAGYFRGSSGYVAILTGPAGSGPTLLRVGERQAELGLQLVDFSLRKVSDHAGASVAQVAQAVLHDERTGNDEVLESGSRKFTGRPLAVLRGPRPERATHELHEAETLSSGGSFYRVERIRLKPAEVVVSRQIAGRSTPLVRVLQPAGSAVDPLQVIPSAPTPPRPADTVATNSN